MADMEEISSADFGNNKRHTDDICIYVGVDNYRDKYMDSYMDTYMDNYMENYMDN